MQCLKAVMCRIVVDVKKYLDLSPVTQMCQPVPLLSILRGNVQLGQDVHLYLFSIIC